MVTPEQQAHLDVLFDKAMKTIQTNYDAGNAEMRLYWTYQDYYILKNHHEDCMRHWKQAVI